MIEDNMIGNKVQSLKNNLKNYNKFMKIFTKNKNKQKAMLNNLCSSKDNYNSMDPNNNSNNNNTINIMSIKNKNKVIMFRVYYFNNFLDSIFYLKNY